jgi:PIN domain nuclease of toxin-antitoxin system
VRYLLDTGVWIWSVSRVERLNSRSREILSSSKEEIYLSAATSWEVSIKMRLGKLHFPGSPAECVPAFAARQSLRLLPVNHNHALGVYDLPLHHRDPFDRLIISQALAEDMTILTADRIFRKYPVQIVWCGK